MEHLLLQNLVGSVLAGEHIYGDQDSRWLGLKPSAKSTVTMYMDRACIQSILHEDGTQETIRPSIPREKQTDLGIPTDHVLLIRVKGGVSYWLEPSPGSGIVLHVPTEEVEEVFGQ